MLGRGGNEFVCAWLRVGVALLVKGRGTVGVRGAEGEGRSRAVGLLVDGVMERDGDGVSDGLTDGVAVRVVRECVLIDAEDDRERVSVALVVEGDVVGVVVTAAATAAG